MLLDCYGRHAIAITSKIIGLWKNLEIPEKVSHCLNSHCIYNKITKHSMQTCSSKIFKNLATVVSPRGYINCVNWHQNPKIWGHVLITSSLFSRVKWNYIISSEDAWYSRPRFLWNRVIVDSRIFPHQRSPHGNLELVI